MTSSLIRFQRTGISLIEVGREQFMFITDTLADPYPGGVQWVWSYPRVESTEMFFLLTEPHLLTTPSWFILIFTARTVEIYRLEC